MEIVLPIVLLAGLFLVAVRVLVPSSWLRALVGVGTQLGRGVNVAPAVASGEWDVFTLPFVRHRIDVLADELERLERDPAVFAKAFRTIVAKSALEALEADASRLVAVPSLDLDRRLDLALELDLDPEASPTQRREVLEL